MKVPFNKVYYTGQEMEFIKDALERKELCGDGYYTRRVSNLLENRFKTTRVLMTTSGTHALEMAAMLAGLKEGDEVIMPSFTFPSTANAIMRQGARPVFAEIDEKTLNIDPDDIIKKINTKTKAIVPVHYGGIGCVMDTIIDIADHYNLTVIEDAAQGVDVSYKNKHLGTWGDFGCYSFHCSKNHISGEGGALAINSNNQSLLERAEVIREKGTNRSRFIRGMVDKYSWVDLGSSFLPSDLLMALLYAQLDQCENIKYRRKKIFDCYYNHLKDYLYTGIIKGMTDIPESCESNYHLFYLLLENKYLRDRVIWQLKKKGISAYFHYIPLHTTKMGKKLGYKSGQLPVTESVGESLLRLPLYTGMTLEEASYVITVLKDILKDIQQKNIDQKKTRSIHNVAGNFSSDSSIQQ